MRSPSAPRRTRRPRSLTLALLAVTSLTGVLLGGCADGEERTFAREDVEGFWQQGLLFGGGADQLIDQVVGVLAIGAFVFVSMTIIFLGIKHTVGLRVSEAEEIEGLDVHEHGYPGYGEDLNLGTGTGIAAGSTAPATASV